MVEQYRLMNGMVEKRRFQKMKKNDNRLSLKK